MPSPNRVEQRLAEIRGAAPTRSPSVRVLAAYSQNTACRLATVGFAARVDFDRLLTGTRFAAPFGQSPFALGRGLAFENLLRADDYAAAFGVLRGPLGLLAGTGRAVNLRSGFPPRKEGLPVREAATRGLIRRVLVGGSDAPHLIDGGVLTAPVSGAAAYYEADALAARAGDGRLHVVEVKSFPRVDDRIDPDQFGAALDQVAVYVLLLRDTVAAVGADPDRMVSDRGLVVTPRNVGLTPVLSEAGVAPRVARIRRVLDAVPSPADVAAGTPAGLSFGPVGDTNTSEDRRLDALHGMADAIGTAYVPNCLSTCGNARFCRHRAAAAESPCVAGTAASRLLPEVLTLGRAAALSRGAAHAAAEEPVAAILRRAGRLIDEADPAPAHAPARRPA